MSHLTTTPSQCVPFASHTKSWLVCLSAGFFFFYEFFQLNLFDVINQSLRADFHVNEATISWISSTYLWANILFLLPAGVILDRYSTRRIVLWAMLLCVLSTFAFAAAHTIAWACFCHFLSGIGNAFCFLACVVLVTRWFPSRQQAFVIGCLVTMAFFGGTMAHTPLAYLTAKFGWRQALLIDGALGIGLMALIFLMVQDRPITTVEKSTVDAGQALDHPHALMLATASYAPVLKNRQNWLAGIYICCLNLPIMVLAALWGTSYLHTVYAIQPISASNIVSLIFIGSMLGCPLFGWLSDQHGRRKPVMIFGVIATGLMFLPLLMQIALAETWLALIFLFIGLFSSTQVIGYPVIAESNDLHDTGKATGIASILVMGGGGLGQIIFGWLLQSPALVTKAHHLMPNYLRAMNLFAVALFIGLIAALCLRETNCRNQQGGM